MAEQHANEQMTSMCGRSRQAAYIAAADSSNNGGASTMVGKSIKTLR